MRERENIPNWRSQLRYTLGEYFSEGDLKGIAFDLRLDLETITGSNKTEKIIGIIDFFEKSDRIEDLIDACKHQRPNINWDEIVSAAKIDRARRVQRHATSKTATTAKDPKIPQTLSNRFLIFGSAIVTFLIIGLIIFLHFRSKDNDEIAQTGFATVTLDPTVTSTMPVTSIPNEQLAAPPSTSDPSSDTPISPINTPVTLIKTSTPTPPSEIVETEVSPIYTALPSTPIPPTLESSFPVIDFADPFEVEIKSEWEGREEWKFTTENMIVPYPGSGTLLIGEKGWNHYTLNVETLQPPFDSEGRPTRTGIILSECSRENGDMFRLILVLESKSVSTGTAFFQKQSIISPNSPVGSVFPSIILENAFTPNMITRVQIITTANQVYASVNGTPLPILDISDPGLSSFIDCWNDNNLDNFSGKVGLGGTNNWQSQFNNFSIKSLELIYENGFENDIMTIDISKTEGILLVQSMPGNSSATSILITKLDDSTAPRGVVFWFRGPNFSQIFDKENRYLLQIDYRSSDRSKCKLTFGINDDPVNRINHPTLQGEDYWQTTQLMPLFISTSVNQIQLTLFTIDQNKSCEYDNLRIYKVPFSTVVPPN